MKKNCKYFYFPFWQSVCYSFCSIDDNCSCRNLAQVHTITIRGTVTKKIDYLGTKARIEVKLSKNQFYLEGNDPTILKNMYYHHKKG